MNVLEARQLVCEALRTSAAKSHNPITASIVESVCADEVSPLTIFGVSWYQLIAGKYWLASDVDQIELMNHIRR